MYEYSGYLLRGVDITKADAECPYDVRGSR